MNNRAFTISFIVAVMAVMMVYSYVTSTEETLKEQYGVEETIVVAKKDIKELDVLDETNLATIPVPRNFKQPGVSSNINELKGGLAIAPIGKGEQITKSKVTQLGARTGLSRQIAIGKRAATIMVDDQSAVAKLIKPGDRVDVLANVNPNPSNKLAAEVYTLLQDVLVLATGKYVTNTVPGILETDPFRQDSKTTRKLSEYTTYPNITLEVDSFQAQVLVWAERNGNGLSMVLRNNDDNVKEEVRKTVITDIIDKESGAKVIQQLNAKPTGGTPAMPGGR